MIKETIVVNSIYAERKYRVGDCVALYVLRRGSFLDCELWHNYTFFVLFFSIRETDTEFCSWDRCFMYAIIVTFFYTTIIITITYN